MSGFRGTPDGVWTVEHMVLSRTSVTGIWNNPPGDGGLLLARYAGCIFAFGRDDSELKEAGVPVDELAELPGYRLPAPGPGTCTCPLPGRGQPLDHIEWW